MIVGGLHMVRRHTHFEGNAATSLETGSPQIRLPKILELPVLLLSSLFLDSFSSES